MPTLIKTAAWLLALAIVGGGGWWGYVTFVVTQEQSNKPNNGLNVPDKQPNLADAMREKRKKTDQEAHRLLLQAMEAREAWDLVKSKSLLEDALYKGPSDYMFLFNTDTFYQISLNNSTLHDNLSSSFVQNSYVLSQNVEITVNKPNEEWLVEDVGKKQKYQIQHNGKNLLVSLILKSEIQNLLEAVKKYMDEFDHKSDQAKINEQNGEIEVARHIYLDLWKDNRYEKLPKRKNIRLPVCFDISPASTLIKVDDQEGVRANSPHTVYCLPTFKEIEISLPGYNSCAFYNSFTTQQNKNDKGILRIALPDEKITRVKLEKNTSWDVDIDEDNKKRKALLVEGNLYYANGVLYMACRNDSVYAYQYTDDGNAPQRLWKLKIGRLSSFSANPVLHQGILYLGGKNGIFYAIDAVKGEIRQQCELENKPLIDCSAVVAAAHGMVFVGASDGFIYAFPQVDASLKTWNALWRFPTKKKIACAPVVVDDLLFIGGADKLFYALNIKSKKVTWYKNLNHPILVSPLVDGNTIYICASDIVGAYQHADGKLLWNSKVQGNVLAIALSKDTLFAVADTQKLFAISKRGEKLWDSGEKAWGKELTGLTNAPSVSSKDTIYLAGQKTVREHDDSRKEGLLYAITGNGQLLWTYKIGVEICAAPQVIGNIVLIGADKLYALLDN
jgi:outer membrane protein assembly factor BamB